MQVAVPIVHDAEGLAVARGKIFVPYLVKTEEDEAGDGECVH